MIVELLLRTPLGEIVADRIADPAETLKAPHLLDLEVAQVLRRFQAARTLGPARAGEAVADLGALDIERFAHTPFLDRIWQLRGALTAYDAAYVALAEILDAPLLTSDKKLASARHEATVELLQA